MNRTHKSMPVNRVNRLSRMIYDKDDHIITAYSPLLHRQTVDDPYKETA
jgi:hypothetical protein